MRLTINNAPQIVLYVLIVIASLYRIVYVIEYNPIDHIWSDTERHWNHGIDVLRDDPFLVSDSILYQLYIGALAKLTLRIPELVAFYTSLLSLLTTWLWYKFFRELQPSKNIALTGWLVISILPSWNGIFGYFMQEALMLFLLGSSMWFSWCCLRKETVCSFALMIAAWTLTGLTKGSCIPLAVVVTIWIWISQREKSKKFLCLAVTLVFLLAPLGYRNLVKTGIFSIPGDGIARLNSIYASSGKREVQIQYYRDGAIWYYGFLSPSLAEQKPLAPVSNWQSSREGVAVVAIDIRNAAEDWKKAAQNYEMSLAGYLSMVKENTIFFIFGESWPDSNKERLLGSANYLLRWIWAPLLILIFSRVCFFKRPLSQSERILLLMIITFLMLHCFFPLGVMEGRYRKPLEGLIISYLVLLIASRRVVK